MSPRTRKNIREIITLLDRKLRQEERGNQVTFNEFLAKLSDDPILVLRNIFQLFNNMVHHYIREEDEYKDDPESISYKTIICDDLLVDGADTPFFADLPLANRILRLADSFKEGAQQNKIYIFMGPPGSGKSTFLTNLLQKLQEYTYLPEGAMYEVVWRLDNQLMDPIFTNEIKAALDDYYSRKQAPLPKLSSDDVLEVPCPNHDHPILVIPREHRREVLENLLKGEAKVKIFNKKEYSWVFKNNACTVCTSIYNALLQKLKSPAEVFKMLYAKRYTFDRRLGKGISVYNPGDKENPNQILTNDVLQRELGMRFRDSNLVKYVFSKYARTNNGAYVIMDVKNNNEKRFLDLHGIISEGTNKISDIEENINSLFIAVMNPEDKTKIEGLESFKDRIKEISVNYTLNYMEEVKIYYSSFGKQIRMRFLPGVLNNFAKIIISTRLNTDSPTMKSWIKNPAKYLKYCDNNLLLLKLSIYNNKIPSYLTDDDYKKFDKKLRQELINESEFEGLAGYSGRESIHLFNEFYTEARKKMAENGGKKNILITMAHIKEFFEKHPEHSERVPKGFMDSVIRLYDYNVVQQMKESLFQKNEERIQKDILNYLFVLNYEEGSKVTSPYSNEEIVVDAKYFDTLEHFILPSDVIEKDEFRKVTAQRFAETLQDIQVSELKVENSVLYKELYNNYMKNLRNNILQPFIEYPSYEKSIADFGSKQFEVYDARTKEQINHLIKNMMDKFNYTLEGAKQTCLYVLSNNLASKFRE